MTGPRVLTKSQAACLMALRNPAFSKPRVAIAAKLDLKRTDAALRKLAELGLVRRSDSKLWSVTAIGETCDFETVADARRKRGRQPRQLEFDLMEPSHEGAESAPPGPRARRLLDLLDRPKSAAALARELGLTRQRVGQLVLHLNAQGRIVFADPERPLWLIKRADDASAVLERDAARVLCAVPAERAADLSGLTTAQPLARHDVKQILDRLVEAGLVKVGGSPGGARVFRLTAAGREHPQYVPSKRPPPPPHLPVRSDRVRLVLQTIADADALRIRDVARLTDVPQQSANALMQYLKRKRLVAKTVDAFEAPYRLTKQGAATLAEMSLRQAA